MIKDYDALHFSPDWYWKYPGGEVGVRAKDEPERLCWRVHNSDELMGLIMYLDGRKTLPESVLIPYLPYARQDTRRVAGDPAAIDVLARLLATTGVKHFACIDAHSEVSREAFQRAGLRLTVYSPLPYIGRFFDYIGISLDRMWFVGPDKGATTKVWKYAAFARGLIECRKRRDSGTGKLSGFEVIGDRFTIPEGDALLVADDICDGGGTFLGVADALDEWFGGVKKYMFTTHAIYSKGLDDLLAHYEKVGSTDSFYHNLVTQSGRLVTVQIGS